jgi:hypothetical protein
MRKFYGDLWLEVGVVIHPEPSPRRPLIAMSVPGRPQALSLSAERKGSRDPFLSASGC